MPETAPSFATLLQRYFADYLTRQRAASPRTIVAYRDTFRLLLLFTERQIAKPPTAVKLTDLDAALVLAFLDYLEVDRGNGSRSRNARLAAIRSFLQYAARQDLSALPVIQQTLAIPMKRCDKPLLGFLAREEMQAILDAPDTTNWTGKRDQALFTVLYNTAARVSEAIGLRVGDIILESSPCVHIHGKGRKQRITPLTTVTVTVLRAWLAERRGEPHQPLFPNRTGGRLSRDAIEKRLAKHIAAATASCPSLKAKHVTAHTLRHTAAMRLLPAGVDTSVIALWLGHEGTETTQVYLHADMTIKEQALARVPQPGTSPGRYRAPDSLLAFLDNL